QDVGEAHALEHAGADDAAGAPGAVDDDGGVRGQIAGEVGDAQGQLAARHAAPAGDAEAAELLGGAAVEDQELLARAQALGQLAGLDLRDVGGDLDLLAEVLAGD